MGYRELGRTGISVSVIGFGASPLGNVFGDISVAEGEHAVRHAIDAGINFFDTSPYYGLTLSEQRLGAALIGRRNQVVLATKCGRYGASEFDFSAERTRCSIEESLERLRTDRIDLLQVHDCEFGYRKQIVEETLPTLEALRDEGKILFIGITGYELGNLEWIARRAIQNGIQLDTVLSYCRYNLANVSMGEGPHGFAGYAHSHGFGLINASPLHMGLLTEEGAPPWHPASARAKKACSNAVKLCQQVGLSIEQLALRFCLDHPRVASTLVGMGTEGQVTKNISVLQSQNDRALIAALRSLLDRNGAAEIWPSGLRENWDAGTVEAVA
jgi:L-galactose dehydrogenase